MMYGVSVDLQYWTLAACMLPRMRRTVIPFKHVDSQSALERGDTVI